MHGCKSSSFCKHNVDVDMCQGGGGVMTYGIGGDVSVISLFRKGKHTEEYYLLHGVVSDSSVIKALRTCQHLQRIVYASCHPLIAKSNFIESVPLLKL